MAKNKKPKLIKESTPETFMDKFSWQFHGYPKTGKTSLAMEFPKAVLLPFDRGFKAMQVRYADIHDWAEAEDAVDLLLKDSKCATVVFDTVDRAVDWLYDWYCKEHSLNHISDQKYAQGYRECNRILMGLLEDIQAADKNFILISHTRQVDSTEGHTSDKRLVPDVSNSPRKVLNAMVDLQGYIYTERVEVGDEEVVKRFVQVAPTADVQSGGRVEWLVDDVELTPTPRKGYQNLKKEFDVAIKRQLAELKKARR